jgi:pilus assembly protein CpaB
MFQNHTFARSHRRKSQAMLMKFGLAIFMVAIAFGGVALSLHLSSQPGVAKTVVPQERVIEPGMVEIIVPLESIPPGATLEPKMFHRVKKPDLVVGPDTIRDFDDIKGLYSRGVLVAEQPVHRDFLTSLQPVNALTASIPAGYRAIAISVDAISSVEGWAQPGARVDVIWVTRDLGSQMAYAIAPNAKVLSANKKAEGARVDSKNSDSEVPTTVTLLLSVRDAMRVRLASLNGRLALVLRGSDDAGLAKMSGPIGEGALFNVGRGVQPQNRNLVSVKVRDRRTGKEELLTFEDGERVRE